MGRDKNMSGNRMVRRLAPFALAATLCFGAAACGSTSKVNTNNAPTTTVHSGGSTPAPTTTAPQSGGAGF